MNNSLTYTEIDQTVLKTLEPPSRSFWLVIVLLFIGVLVGVDVKAAVVESTLSTWVTGASTSGTNVAASTAGGLASTLPAASRAML